MPSRLRKCQDCDSGFLKGNGKCAQCHGTGVNTQLDSIQPKCPYCHGTGMCATCDGSGIEGDKDNPDTPHRAGKLSLQFQPERIFHRAEAAGKHRRLLVRSVFIAVVGALWAKSVGIVFAAANVPVFDPETEIFVSLMIGGLAAVVGPALKLASEDRVTEVLSLNLNQRLGQEEWALTTGKTALLLASFAIWGICELALGKPHCSTSPDKILTVAAQQTCSLSKAAQRSIGAAGLWTNQDEVAGAAALRKQITAIREKLGTVCCTREGDPVRFAKREKIQYVLALHEVALQGSPPASVEAALILQGMSPCQALLE